MTRFLIFSCRGSNIPRLHPPREFETLDDLLAQAAHYEQFCRRE